MKEEIIKMVKNINDIKILRIKKGLNQSQLAKRLHISKSYMSRLERKVEGFSPSINIVINLAKELDCNPVDTFLFFANSNKTKNRH